MDDGTSEVKFDLNAIKSTLPRESASEAEGAGGGTAEVPKGNTGGTSAGSEKKKKERTPESRSWVFTSFEDKGPEYDPDVMRYLGYGREYCPDTKKMHWQGFVKFHKAKTKGATQKNLGSLKNEKGAYKMRVDIQMGTDKQNFKYCSKDKEYVEWGTIEKHQGERNDLLHFRNEIIDGTRTVEDIILSEPMVFHQYGRTLERLELIKSRRTTRESLGIVTKGFWYYGGTGVGKSLTANSALAHPGTKYRKVLKDQWWEDYSGQDVCIIEEYRGKGLDYADLLALTDRWDHSVIKRNIGQVPFISKEVVITSPMDPWSLFAQIKDGPINNKDSINQLIRRFKIIHVKGAGIYEEITEPPVEEAV